MLAEWLRAFGPFFVACHMSSIKNVRSACYVHFTLLASAKQQPIGGSAMSLDFAQLHKNLWYREQTRRRAINAMRSRLSTYADAKKALLARGSTCSLEFPLQDLQEQLRIIEAVEAADLNCPIGPAAGWSVEQLIVVPVDISPRFAVVRDGDIPEPWETRFGVYNQAAARIPEGSYVWDWEAFKRDWEAKMSFLARLRMRIKLEELSREED